MVFKNVLLCILIINYTPYEYKWAFYLEQLSMDTETISTFNKSKNYNANKLRKTKKK